jgi:hypothetical protein
VLSFLEPGGQSVRRVVFAPGATQGQQERLLLPREVIDATVAGEGDRQRLVYRAAYQNDDGRTGAWALDSEGSLRRLVPRERVPVRSPTFWSQDGVLYLGVSPALQTGSPAGPRLLRPAAGLEERSDVLTLFDGSDVSEVAFGDAGGAGGAGLALLHARAGQARGVFVGPMARPELPASGQGNVELGPALPVAPAANEPGADLGVEVEASALVSLGDGLLGATYCARRGGREGIRVLVPVDASGRALGPALELGQQALAGLPCPPASLVRHGERLLVSSVRGGRAAIAELRCSERQAPQIQPAPPAVDGGPDLEVPDGGGTDVTVPDQDGSGTADARPDADGGGPPDGPACAFDCPDGTRCEEDGCYVERSIPLLMGTDDAYQDTAQLLAFYGWISLYNHDAWGGLRFRIDDLPRNVSLRDVALDVVVDSDKEDRPKVMLQIDGDPDNPPFDQANVDDISRRRVRPESVIWDSGDVAIGEGRHRSPDLTALLQGLVDQPEWHPGGYATFILRGLPEAGVNDSVFEIRQVDFDGGSSGALLHLRYRVN